MLKYVKQSDGHYLVKSWSGLKWQKVARITVKNGNYRVMKIVIDKWSRPSLSVIYFGSDRREAFQTLSIVRQ